MLSTNASNFFLEKGNISIDKDNYIVPYNKKIEDELKKTSNNWSSYIKPKTLKYANYIKKLKLKKIETIKNNSNLLDEIKYLSNQLFDNISKKSYPSGLTRSNHGSYNHMRSLYLGIYLSKYSYKINILQINLLQNKMKCFIIVMATYFVAICRINEGNFIHRNQVDKKEDLKNAKIKLSSMVVDSWFQNEKSKIKKCSGYFQSIHQYYSCLMFVSIMKQIMSEEYHSLIELCGFSICYFHNDKDEKEESLEPIFFLHYFINTPHYIDHCRGAYTAGLNDLIPQTLIKKYLISKNKLEFSKKLLIKSIENFYLSEEFKKPKELDIEKYVNNEYRDNDKINMYNFCYKYIKSQELIKGHLKAQQNINTKTQSFRELWNKLDFKLLYNSQ